MKYEKTSISESSEGRRNDGAKGNDGQKFSRMELDLERNVWWVLQA